MAIIINLFNLKITGNIHTYPKVGYWKFQGRGSSQIDVHFSCVCPVSDHEFCHNTVKVAVDPRGNSQVDPQTTLTML